MKEIVNPQFLVANPDFLKTSFSILLDTPILLGFILLVLLAPFYEYKYDRRRFWYNVFGVGFATLLMFYYIKYEKSPRVILLYAAIAAILQVFLVRKILDNDNQTRKQK